MLGLHLLAAALIAAMTLAGLWQLGSFRDRQALSADEVAAQQPVPLDDVLGPDEAFGAEADRRRVAVEGEYAAPQLLVEPAVGDAQLVTPLLTPTGSAVLVVRGTSPTLAPAPAGPVEVVGTLLPSQARADDLDPGDERVPALNIAQLVGRFDFDVYSGFVILAEQQPVSRLPTVAPPEPEPGLTAGLRNLMYALQWWAFGGFAGFFWWRIVRERARVA
jgi:cytochrome oxidase assembly protein ShyY1